MATRTNEIKVNGYRGTWSIVDYYDVVNDIGLTVRYAMLEHDYYGDETCYLVIEDSAVNWSALCPDVYIGPVYETYDGIETCLEDEGVI